MSDAMGLRVFANGAAMLGRAKDRRVAFASAKPFPHAVIDGLFADDVLDAAIVETPAPQSGADLYTTHKPGQSERKFALRDWARFGPATFELISTLHAGPFITFLEDLTGISGLIPDPTLNGGGHHMIVAGGLLGVHADFNIHPQLRLKRRLNLLLYLNRDWRPEWGGDLELWERDMSACAVKLAPSFNRTVIFETTSDSFHGHPDPLTCPPDAVRRSLALYYYTAEGADAASHSTLYQKRPG